MEISIQSTLGICEVTISGSFTFADHSEFHKILDAIANNDVQKITLRMPQVEFVDSAALGMLLLARDEAQKHNKQLVINGVAGQVKKMFEMAKFNTLFVMN